MNVKEDECHDDFFYNSCKISKDNHSEVKMENGTCRHNLQIVAHPNREYIRVLQEILNVRH